MNGNEANAGSDRFQRRVGMGELAVLRGAGELKTLLGSCIGLVLYDRQLVVAGLAHIVQPQTERTDQPPGKYAITAVPELIRLIEQKGGRRRSLEAWFAGGASMFDSNLSNQIGLQNSAAVRQLLRDFGIRVMAEDCGGKRGRQLSFDVVTGIATVAVLGNSPIVMQPSEQGAHE